MCCTRLAENTGRKNYAQKSPSPHHNTKLSNYISATKARIDHRKKIAKHQYLLHMSSRYGELRPPNGWDLLASLGHPSKFQRASRLGFVTAPKSPHEGQPNCIMIGRLLGWYTQNSLWVQVLRSPILAALLHGNRAVGVSQTLRRDIFTRHGGHPVRHWAVELSSIIRPTVLLFIACTMLLHFGNSEATQAVTANAILLLVAGNFVARRRLLSSPRGIIMWLGTNTQFN